MPPLPGQNRLANVLGESRVVPLIQRWLNPPEHQRKHALAALLMVTYAQSANRVVQLRTSNFHQDAAGHYWATFAEVAIPLDGQIANLLERQLAALTEADDDYLFPGRRDGSPMSESTLSSYLCTFNVTATELYATALFRTYARGVRQPQVLNKGLGVSEGTAVAYYEAFNTRMINEAETWMQRGRRPRLKPAPK
jgi:hypothetical protein